MTLKQRKKSEDNVIKFLIFNILSCSNCLANCGGLRCSHHQQLSTLINNKCSLQFQQTKNNLNVINEDVQNVKQFTKMPAISDELYNRITQRI